MPSAFHHSTSKRRKKRSKEAPTIHRQEEEEAEPQEELEEEGDGGFELRPGASLERHAIQPLGNLLLLVGPSGNIRDVGLGSLRALSDELLLDLVLSRLPARDLAVLSAVSRSLFVFSTHEPLWRSLVLRDLGGDFSFQGSWRSTYVSTFFASEKTPSTLCITNFYSDYLFQSWLCANLQMKPEWLRIDNIQRRRGICVEEFIRSFEEPNEPVLLEGCLANWLAMEKWDRHDLIHCCADVRFSVGPVEMTLEKYFQYADAVKEERPLYLFDPKFADKVPELGLDYEVPIYFREDLFAVLGKERPDYRWIIIGPTGSGSSFHVDPNCTSAWNAVVRGSKKWVMFPPDVVPPGVHPSPDGVEVACPVSIMEWFMNFYAVCKKWKRRPIECVCRAGEVVFVPNGWWHLVVNLEDSIAITQNYVSRRNLLNVLNFLRKPNASELVSGTKDRVNLYDKFKSAIDVSFPGTIDELTLKAQEKMAQQKKLTFWEAVTDANSGGFKFSF